MLLAFAGDVLTDCFDVVSDNLLSYPVPFTCSVMGHSILVYYVMNASSKPNS